MTSLATCSIDQLNQFIAMYNALMTAHSGGRSQVTVGVHDVLEAYKVVESVQWRPVTVGVLSGKAMYAKTPHGVLVQNEDKTLSLFSNSMAQTLLGILSSELF